MHELALCRAIAETAADHADGRSVCAVHLRIGHFRQVVPETLQFCWDLSVKDTALEGCRLHVDYIPVVLRCRTCAEVTTLTDPIMLCGSCDGADVEMTSGEEFVIEAIDLAPSEP